MSHLKLCHSLMHIRTPRNAAGKQANRGKDFLGDVK